MKILWNAVYDKYIEAMDAIDNGILQLRKPGKKYFKSNTCINHRVKHLNPNWNEEFDEARRSERFEKASTLIEGECSPLCLQI